MTEKTIIKTINKNKPISSGFYGRYYQLSSKRGIKINYAEFDNTDDPNFSALLNIIKKDATNLKIARKRFRFVPKFYAIRILTINGKIRIGIEMQHLGNKTASSAKISYDHDSIYSTLKKRGIVHTDIHAANLMWYKNRIWVIDLDSSHVTIHKNYEKI